LHSFSFTCRARAYDPLETTVYPSRDILAREGQRLRHANVSTTASYEIKSAAGDVKNAMATLAQNIPNATEAPQMLRDTDRTSNSDSAGVPGSVN
jgi:hypothetical protein